MVYPVDSIIIFLQYSDLIEGAIWDLHAKSKFRGLRGSSTHF